MARAENKVEAGGTALLVAALAKALREQLGLTQEELGKRIGYTASAISAMETCAQPASDKMLVALEKEIGGGLGIFEKARKFILLDKYPPQFKNFALMEREAVSLSSYQTYVIDGRFQTPEYARALIGGGFPKLPDAKVEELVEARIARRALLDRTDPTPMIELILDESALRRPIGGWEVLRDQLRSLAEDAERDNVSIQVMPMERGLRGGHAGTRGDMVLVVTKDHHHVVYMEIEDESVLVSDPAKVAHLTHRYAKIRTQALSRDDSLSLIQKLAGEERT
ncbi:helix-turn-helix domain-containing protein [Streptomyces diastatochromogenes]|uniref:Transcriptional regulator n=1 Tax=Streptomyces diastatochromogenes TaxID=42236 RepID=A0A233SPK1_STRDA|nr:helix-turn-helix transcriptional regulator [Streptomyces diastatochromogenes]MCZ0987877.1 helix-turn-helix transcriptional regulator [Streptomyces diastatochromogenes]OXY97581.1 transcriptional regulator [Streptomyces diastatochromogenes]